MAWWAAGIPAGMKTAGRNINNPRCAHDTPVKAASGDTLKSLWTEVKGLREEAGLKLNIQKTKIMAFSPITSWQIDGETMETVTAFMFMVSKIIADGNCSHEIKRHLLLGRKAMTNLDSVLKSRDLTSPNKGPSSRSYVFFSSHVWM